MTTRAEQRKKMYRLKRKKRIIRALQFIIILGAVYAFIFYTPFFNVKTINVEGVAAVSPQAVISASGITEGMHILKINKKAAAGEIEKLAYVKSAEIKRSFPNKVRIILTEGKVLANIALDKGFAAIDETGKVMEMTDTLKVYPAVYGLTVKKSEVGTKITIDETDRFDVILKYINQLNLQALTIPYVSISDIDGDVWAELENGLLVLFGDDKEIDYKVAAFAESLRSAGDVTTGYFDVSTPDRIVYSSDSPFKEETEEETEETQAVDEPLAEEQEMN